MRRLLIGTTLGVAAAFAIGACGEGSNDDHRVEQDRQEIIDSTWAEFAPQICPPYRSAVAQAEEMGMTEDDVIDLMMDMADVEDPETAAIVEDLVRTRC